MCAEDKTGKELSHVKYNKTENQLSVKDMEVGEPTRKALKSMSVDEQKHPLLGMRSFFHEVSKYLLSHLPLDNEMLQDLACLHPLCQKESKSTGAIKRVALRLPQVVSSGEVGLLMDEWKIYQEEKIPKNWYIVPADKQEKMQRIDFYWNKILKQKNARGDYRFTILPKLIKSVLTLAHGNADVERSLSDNRNTVTKERTRLTTVTINGLRLVKDYVNKTYNGDVKAVTVTKEMIAAARSAHEQYKRRKREEKEKEEKLALSKKATSSGSSNEDAAHKRKKLEEEKASIADKEKKLVKSDEESKDNLRRAETLFSEANSRLAKSIKNKDFDEAAVAQGLLDVAKNKMEECRKSLDECADKRKALDSRKRKIIDDLSRAAGIKRKK